MSDIEMHMSWSFEIWHPRALCKEHDPSLFFPVGITGRAVRQISEAKSICRECPVSMQCLEFAVRSNQEYGIWGGKDENERRAIRRMRRKRHQLAILA